MSSLRFMPRSSFSRCHWLWMRLNTKYLYLLPTVVHRAGERQYTGWSLTIPQVVNFSRHVIRLTSYSIRSNSNRTNAAGTPVSGQPQNHCHGIKFVSFAVSRKIQVLQPFRDRCTQVTAYRPSYKCLTWAAVQQEAVQSLFVFMNLLLFISSSCGRALCHFISLQLRTWLLFLSCFISKLPVLYIS